MVIVGLIMYDVIMRYVLNSPVPWPSDISLIFFAIYSIVGGAYTLHVKGHVRMDLIYNRLSLRQKAITDLVTGLLFFIYVVVLLWKGSLFGLESLQAREKAWTLFGAPMYPAKLALGVGALLMLLQGTAEWCRALITTITGKEAV